MTEATLTSKAMTAEHEQALKWAREQNFGSVAARYAKLCAEAYDIVRSETLEAFNMRVCAAVRASHETGEYGCTGCRSTPCVCIELATPGCLKCKGLGFASCRCPLPVVTDRMQGVDCPDCEESIPHTHAQKAVVCARCHGDGRVNEYRIGNLVNIPCPECSQNGGQR